jgi:hypothetical protein
LFSIGGATPFAPDDEARGESRVTLGGRRASIAFL